MNQSRGRGLPGKSGRRPGARPARAASSHFPRKLLHIAAAEGLEARTFLTVTAPSAQTGGWTVIEPSADSLVYYVDNTPGGLGNDNNNGLSPQSPLLTVNAARNKLRSGFPDWMLLKRGNVYNGVTLDNWNRSGRNEQEPMVVGTYGDPSLPRPTFVTGNNVFALRLSGSSQASHLAFMGLAFTPGTPDTVAVERLGFRTAGANHNILLEDTSFTGYQTNLVVEEAFGPATNIKVRRSIIADAYAANSSYPTANNSSQKSQGIYAQGVNGLLLEENIFDHNGWNEAVAWAGANIHNHNIYIQSNSENVVIRGNIIANASSHGLQARAGGIIQNNLFLDNAIAMTYGYVDGDWAGKAGGVSGEVTGNVVVGGRDIDGNIRGWGLEIGNVKPGGTLVANNTFSNSGTQTGHAAVKFTYGSSRTTSFGDEELEVGINDLTFENNAIYSWARGIFVNALAPNGTGRKALNNLVVRNNDVQAVREVPLVEHLNSYQPPAEAWSNNRYAGDASRPNEWFKLGSTNQSLSQWQSAVEPSATSVVRPYPDATRSAATYNATQGGTATLKGFLDQARRQSKTFWRPQYQAAAVNRYVQDGFAIDAAAPTAALEPVDPYTVGGAEALTFTVNWSDDVALNAASISNGDVRALGPNGYNQPATLLYAIPDGSGRGIAATYSIPAPDDEAWKSTDNGTYTVGVQFGEVRDAKDKLVPAGEFAALQVNIASAAPTAKFTATDIGASKTTPHSLTVTYTSSGQSEVPLTNSTFESPQLLPGMFAYQAPDGWGAGGFAGVSSNGSVLTGFNGPAPEGQQVAFLDGEGSSIAQFVNDWGSGTYTIKFQGAQRAAAVGQQQIRVVVDGAIIGAVPLSSTYQELSVGPFTVGPGPHYLELVNIGGDVSFLDDVQVLGEAGVDESTLDSGDLRVTGPNGFSQIATYQSAQDGQTPGTLEVTYTLNAPAGGWVQAANGVYSVSSVANQVLDILGTPLPAGKLGSFRVNIVPPTVTVIAPDVTSPGTVGNHFTMYFADDVGVNSIAMSPSSLAVISPSGVEMWVWSTGSTTGSGTLADPYGGGYRVDPPGGSWDASDNGLYYVAIKANSVSDAQGNVLPAGPVGSFRVNIDAAGPTAVIPNGINSVTTPGTSSFTFEVGYGDDTGVDTSSIGTGDLVVTGPNGYSATPTIFGTPAPRVPGAITPIYATYSLPAPSGGWKSSHNGTYTVSLNPNQVRDTAGTFAASQSLATFSVTIETTPPTATIQTVTPNPRNSSVSSLTVSFSESVTGVDLADFTLRRDGSTVPFNGAQFVSGSGSSYTINGLSALTAASGAYQLTLTASGSGITDAAGNAMAVNATQTWTTDTTAPTVLVQSVTPNPRTTPVSSMTIGFSERITSFDLSDLTLTRDGGANLLNGSQTLTTSDSGQTWTLNNLSSLTAGGGRYTLALKSSGHGITDLAGNAPSSGTTSTTFDVQAPVQTSVQINDGSVQRSVIISITISFDRAVTADSGAFELIHRNVGGVTPVVTASGDLRTYVLSFPGLSGQSLGDGIYDFTVRASAIRDGAGNSPSLDTVLKFHRLFSDVDGDGDSDNADLFQMRTAYGKAAPDPAYSRHWDYDGDGDVDNADVFQVRARRNILYQGY